MSAPSQNEENTVIISNPLKFMTKAYIQKILKKLKFISEKDLSSITINYIYHSQLPSNIYITFPSKEIADKFINEYNGKSFETTLD